MLRITIICLIYLVTNNISHAFPKPQSTRLPMYEKFLKNEPENALNVLALEVYQDSVDENLYYYVPPFHIRQYREGAASPFISSMRIGHYAEAERLLQERDDYFKEHYKEVVAYFKVKVDENEKKLNQYRQYLADAIKEGNPSIIEIWQDAYLQIKPIFDRSIQELADADIILQNVLANGFDGGPEGMKRSYLQQIAMNLYHEGFDIRINLPVEELFDEINKARSHFEQQDAGFLTVNAYAGFTKAQLEGLRKYKAEYASDIKVALLKINNLTLFGLNEAKEGDKTQRTNFKMFHNADGSGDYLGMTVYMDVTVAGGHELSKHLGPFILPVGIKGELDQFLTPVEGKLVCDFTNGFSVKGRADIRDGAVVFDNDITKIMKSNDENKGGCTLTTTSGDYDSAEFQSLRELQQELEKIYVSRISLSKAEKDKYYAGVLEDIKSNRRPANSGPIGNFVSSFIRMGVPGLVVAGLSYAADFHWHTNVQNVENLSKVNFTREISIKGHERISKDLATSLCLIYNPLTHAYDRCTDEEFEKAESMQKAGKKASASDVCKGIKDPFECGKRRDEILERKDRYHNHDDNKFVNDI